VSQFLSKCSANAMVDAAANLLTGGLVAFPTETVYGLGADACNAGGVAGIYSVKGRPADHPLIVHVASMDGLGDSADDVPGYAISLARDFWPGPMTLVVKRSSMAADFLTGGQDTVGARIPDHPVAFGLLEAFVRAGCKGVAAPKTHEEFAWVLYSALRAADEQGLETVVVEQPVGDGIVVAIRDRLKRASHQANESRM